LSLARSARQDDSRSGGGAVGGGSPRGVEHRRRAGRPAAAWQRVAGSASACSAPTDERSGARSAPSPQPVLRRTMPTPSSFASAMPTVERPKDGRAREVGDGLQIGRRAPAPPARRMARPQSAGAIVAVVGRSLAEHVPRARPRGDVALCPSPRRFRPASIGGERGGGVAVKPGLGRFAAARGRRPTPGRWRMPSRALGGRQPLLGRSKSPSRHPGWKPPTQEWGQFRTVNWTLNAETRLQRERRGPGRRP
jgi:hypothetical protein